VQGQALWNYQCEEEVNADSPTIQDSITQKVAKALAVKLSGEEWK
jgi:TolB-like protein